MALTDLTDLDILDMTFAHSMPEKEKEELVDTYTELFAQVLSKAVGSKLSEQDDKDMESLLQDPSVTAEKIMEFYEKRIPNFEGKIGLAALQFKKMFLLRVYATKLAEYDKKPEMQGKEAWQQIIKDAQDDNWNEVVRMLNVIKSMSQQNSFLPPTTN